MNKIDPSAQTESLKSCIIATSSNAFHSRQENCIA